MSIRFHLDESVPPIVAEELARRGMDVTTSQQTGLLGASDDVQLRFAVAEKRVLVTHDRDFTRIDASGSNHLGMCYCRRDKYGIGELVEMIVLVNECFTEEEMKSHVEFL